MIVSRTSLAACAWRLSRARLCVMRCLRRVASAIFLPKDRESGVLPARVVVAEGGAPGGLLERERFGGRLGGSRRGHDEGAGDEGEGHERAHQRAQHTSCPAGVTRS